MNHLLLLAKFFLTSKVATVLDVYTEPKAVTTYQLAKYPVPLGWNNKSGRLVGRTDAFWCIGTTWLWGSYLSRAPLWQRFSWNDNNGLDRVAQERAEQNSLSIFISYHTPNVQHWTQFCCFDVRNINCLKKQYTNKLLQIKKMHTSLTFCCLQKTQFTVSIINRVERKKISAHYKTHQVQRRQINTNILHKTVCSNYANTNKLTRSHSKL